MNPLIVFALSWLGTGLVFSGVWYFLALPKRPEYLPPDYPFDDSMYPSLDEYRAQLAEAQRETMTDALPRGGAVGLVPTSPYLRLVPRSFEQASNDRRKS